MNTTLRDLWTTIVILLLTAALAVGGVYAGYLHFKLEAAKDNACPCGKNCPCKPVAPHRRPTGDLPTNP